MDIIAYSVKPIDKQTELLTRLQDCVQASYEFQQAQARNDLICLPTGDGMALVFFGDPVCPVKCALEIATVVKAQPELKLRMGLHTGPVCRHADIRNEINVVGGGINMAQRVMDCADAGHILLSRTSAEVLQQMSGWPECLHDLGTHEVKHGVSIQLYNLVKGDVGNPALPRKVGALAIAAPTNTSAPIQPAGWRSGRSLLIGGAVLFLAFAGLATYWRIGPFSPPAVAPPLASAQTEDLWRTLRYYVMVQKYRNGQPYQAPFRLSGDRIFEADYRIRLIFSSPETGYLYIVNEGAASTPQAPVFNTLFPSPLNKNSSALLSSGQEIQIPEKGFLVFDKEKGTEKLWIVWSKASLSNLEALKKWINFEDRGAVRDPVQLRDLQSFFAKYAGLTPPIERDEQNMISVVRVNGGSLVHLIKLTHD